jgi:predicted SAM-dependent methyltransferase
VKLNLGCGTYQPEGFIHVDLRPLPGVDVVCDVSDPAAMKQFRGAEYILASDVIEHLPREIANATLALWVDLLGSDGTLEVWCPDFRHAIAIHPDARCELLLYGGQDYPENFHRCGFTLATMQQKFTDLGLTVTQAVNTGVGNLKVVGVK